ncbi:DNA polymerase III subunit gamma/tau [Candidatus Vallotia lariciata]|uniref:DNA polymerase III subunit gamma/tau n=1 Tax=Candidatus Vallotia laricis TaxID=2018052 RepID=UPI001D02B08A|nr:DNA polymerase III subunit gamma/tau [Candidatus Vallotia lariciata]UDG83117.1 Holliday junction ATP-dependent DNA helicase RuvB [Candidatus Vallotia lariciata]
MIHQVLARKWRPRDFASLVGQEHVVRALTHILQAQRLHHAYLFTGTRGVGKTTLSRILAKSLNCETGITATPCGVCTACCKIEEGHFVDYLEMDAASNRGVDEMAALLEHAVYAPVDARFKIYMIDEVHMLTHHAFNSMLKMLEEPPSHVKFILATTDPQKIPVTVLSRCLQFNLKQMPIGYIVSHLELILANEGISFEMQALRLLSRAADGSMRDALSLTDQAIGYSAGMITEQAVRSMLGALDQSYLTQLLDAIIIRDGTTVLSISDEIAARSLSFSTALQDLSGLLHRIAWAQIVPDSILDEWPEAENIRHFAAQIAPEDVQLYYQIATIGRAELGLAPDGYAGFTMALLRMLVFDTMHTACGSVSGDTQPTSSTPLVGYPDAEGLISSRICVPETGKASIYFPRLPKFVQDRANTDEVIQAEERSMQVMCMNAIGQINISADLGGIDTARSRLDEIHEVKIANALSDVTESSSIQLELKGDIIAPSLSKAAVSYLDILCVNTLAKSKILSLRSQVDSISSRCTRTPAVALKNSPFEVSIKPGIQRTSFKSESFVSRNDTLPNNQSVPLSASNRTFDVNTPHFTSMVDNVTHDVRTTVPSPVPDISLNSLGYDGDWPTLVTLLPLRGIAYQLALHSELIACNCDELVLRVSVPQYTNVAHVNRLKTAIEQVLGRLIHVTVSVGPAYQTAAAVEFARRAQQQQKAEQEINSDPFVRGLIREFGATIVLDSIRPLAVHY